MTARVIGMRDGLGRLGRCHAGAAAVEFALLVLPLIFLIGGIIEAGALFWGWEALEETATATARCAGLQSSSCKTTAQITSYAQNAALNRGFGGLTTSDVQVTTISSAGTACGGSTGVIEVTLLYQYTWIIPQMPATTITATACYPLS